MRETTAGLHRGQRVHVARAGKRGYGSVSIEPQAGASHVFVRDDYSGGERLYPIARVHAIRPPRLRAP